MSIREHEQEPARPAPRLSTGSGAGETPRTGPLARVQSMLEDVVAEIRKVTWPTRTETRNLTIVVIGISVLVGGLLGFVDLILVALLRVFTGG